MEQFSTSTDDFNYFPTSKELNASKYRRNNRHRKDIIRRMQKEKEKKDKIQHPESSRILDPIEENKESSRKFNDYDPSCYQSREDRAWFRPNVCGCHWTLKKNDWYVRHHRDRARKGKNKSFRTANVPRQPSYKTKFDIKQIISDEVNDQETSTETYYQMIFKKIAKEAAFKSPNAYKDRVAKREHQSIINRRNEYKKFFNKMALQAGYLTWKWYKDGTPF